MPYVITTYPQDQEIAVALEYGTGRRRAVATLEDAIEYTFERMGDVTSYSITDAARISNAIHALTQAGGTVGPLPDGTVIEVARVSWFVLRDAADLEPGIAYVHMHADATRRNVLDAYNTRQT